MANPLEASASERGLVRVFTTDLEPEGDAAITPKNVHKLLGDGIDLDSKKGEVLPAAVVPGATRRRRVADEPTPDGRTAQSLCSANILAAAA